jgi:glycosyltransferase involved in cell wall biosynthesis
MNSKSIHLQFPTMEEYCNLPAQEARMIGGRRLLKERTATSRGLVSIITVCFNSVATIERTIRSVVEQHYSHVEYIVIDGGSSDGTVDVLRKWDEHIDLWVSERDDGISDAFNKGIAAANGEFAMLVSADDWLEPHYVEAAVNALSACRADYVFGDLLMHAPDGRVVGSLAGDPAYADHLARFRMPNINHPTFVYRRDAFARYGLFNPALRQSMDYEWAMRVVARGGRGKYFQQLVSHVGLEGISDRSFARSLSEVREISIAYGCPVAIAWTRFIARLLKGHARRRLERLLPEPAYVLLRSAINRGFGKADGIGAAPVAARSCRMEPGGPQSSEAANGRK